MRQGPKTSKEFWAVWGRNMNRLRNKEYATDGQRRAVVAITKYCRRMAVKLQKEGE